MAVSWGVPNASALGTSFDSENDLRAETENQRGVVRLAFVVNDLIKPTAVIASHANEAATSNGQVVAGTRTATFIEASTMPVHVPLSGKTMEFDDEGRCTSGCG